jgi:hypothetical protein
MSLFSSHLAYGFLYSRKGIGGLFLPLVSFIVILVPASRC